MCAPRADTESTSEHLEALRKLCSDLAEQRTTLEELRDHKLAILPRLSLLDKELVKQQVKLYLCKILIEVCWVQFYTVFYVSPGGTSRAALVST